MKLNIEVEIPGINQDQTLEEEFQNRIIDLVVKRISKRIDSEARNRITEAVSGRINEAIDQVLNITLANFLDAHVVVTNRWGDRIDHDGTVNELLKKRFDLFWQDKVNRDGVVSDYNATQTRMEWLIGTRIETLCKKFAADIADKVDKQVKDILSDRLKASVGGGIIDKIGVPELIKQLAGKIDT